MEREVNVWDSLLWDGDCVDERIPDEASDHPAGLSTTPIKYRSPQE